MKGQALTLIKAIRCYRVAVVRDEGGATELITEDRNGFVADAPTIKIVDSALEEAWYS